MTAKSINISVQRMGVYRLGLCIMRSELFKSISVRSSKCSNKVHMEHSNVTSHVYAIKKVRSRPKYNRGFSIAARRN